MAAGSLTLGGNLSIALGPLGRNGEALGSLNTSGKLAAMLVLFRIWTLFHSLIHITLRSTGIVIVRRKVFLEVRYNTFVPVATLMTILGISVEGSVIAERQDANALAYHSEVSVKGLLSGAVPRPDWAQPLYQTLDSCTKFRGGQREWVDDSPAQEQEYAFAGLSSSGAEQQPRMLQKKKKSGPPLFPPSNWGEPKSEGSYFNNPVNTPATRDVSAPAWDLANQDSRHATSGFETQFESDFHPQDDRFRQSHNRGFSTSAVPSPKSRSNFGSDKGIFSVSDDDSSGAGISRASTYSASYSSYNRPANASRGPTMPIPFAEQPSITGSPFDSEPDRQLFDEPSPMLTRPVITPKAELTTPLTPGEGVGRAIALFDFNAVEVGDQVLSLFICLRSSHCSPAISRSRRERLSRSPRRPGPRIHGT